MLGFVNALYRMHGTLASIVLLVSTGCSKPPDGGHDGAPEPWPNAVEAVLQNAEALRFARDQHNLEQQRLDGLQVEGMAPLLPYRPPPGS